MPTATDLSSKLRELDRALRATGGAVVAFSGGTDSALVASAARPQQELDHKILARKIHTSRWHVWFRRPFEFPHLRSSGKLSRVQFLLEALRNESSAAMLDMAALELATIEFPGLDVAASLFRLAVDSDREE